MIIAIREGTQWIRKDGKTFTAKQLKQLTDILEKYKIPAHLTDVEIYVQSLRETERSLIFSGLDSKRKRQYFYGKEYVKMRAKKKLTSFLHVHEYYDSIQKDIQKNLSSHSPCTKEFVMYLALLFSSRTYIRTGLMKSYETYGTTGLLTLKLSNINILSANKVSISFIGKDQVHHSFEIVSSHAVRQAKELSSHDQFYFSFWQEDKLTKLSESELYKFMSENYDGIRIKDIRMYGANIIFVSKVIELSAEKLTSKQIISKAIEETAKTIGHTKSICKKSYLVDEIVQFCSNNISAVRSLEFVISQVRPR